jgi:1-deoxy-D-xylulose-5-phosphate synthase
MCLTHPDLLIWDVGHQAYGHKILTGRRIIFIRTDNWVGYPVSKSESIYDAFGVGPPPLLLLLGMAMPLT